VKVAIYAIAKNESNNLDGWYKNISNADHVLILDTGSDDDTVEKARSLGITVYEAAISPWDEARAKNIAMSLLPKDIDFCVCLDLDEHMSDPEWINAFTHNMSPGIYITTSIGVDGVNSFDRPVKNVHPRFGYYWKGFRSAIHPYPGNKALAASPVIPVFAKAATGDQDRFDNRDPLYVQSFLNQVLMLQEDSQLIDDQIQVALAHLALSYYEIEDYESFKKTYSIFYKGNQENIQASNNLQFVEFLDYAMAMIDPSVAESTYMDWIKKSRNPIIPASRLAMFLALSNQPERLSSFLEEHRDILSNESGKDLEVMDTKIIIDKVVLDCLEYCKAITINHDSREMFLESITDIYSSIGWGKRHKDLAIKAADYGKI